MLLVGCALPDAGTHGSVATSGMSIIWNTWLRPSLGALRQSRRQRAIGVLAGVLPVATGLFFMWKEPLLVFSSHAARFKAAITQSIYYQF